MPLAAAPSPENGVTGATRRPGPMASSGAEVHWAELGPGKGPRRRRWAWAEEEKDAAVGNGQPGWGDGGPFPSATGPELLEDFRLAQQRPQPPEWPSGPRPAGHQDSESGESVEEELEAEDADSPESSSLPVVWLPRQDSRSDMTEEEGEEAPGDQGAEEAGGRSPGAGYGTGLCAAGGDGRASPLALGWGWGPSSQQASGDKLPEHSEVSPTADSSVRSWSSGTTSLDPEPRSDSLDSAWEGETAGPQPPARAEAPPAGHGPRLPEPEGRTGGSVAPATPTGFQGPAAPRAPSRQAPAGRCGGERTAVSCAQPGDLAWKRARISPKALPSRFTGSVGPPSSPPRPARRDRAPSRPGAAVAGRASSDAAKYGRGRLNHPLPDFSKVGPRVRFPKDESYRPPKPRSCSGRPQDPVRPLIFKSPAEIVRDVLLSGEEAGRGQAAPAAHPVARVPQEFRTPEQATRLVHQLQEDYHKLLTKYAEAENTIDQLRLGAKVNLYSDPPQPSHSTHTGTVPPGTKVLSFTIPQPRSAEHWPGPSEASGWSSAQGDPGPSSPSGVPTPGCLPEDPGAVQTQPPEERTQALASKISRLLAKVESFVGLMQAGRLTPQDQLKGFRLLKAAHSALEEDYLRACRERPRAPRRAGAGSQGTPGKFDPGRELEAEIFQLGVHLEELRDHVGQKQQEPEPAGSDSPPDSPPATRCPHQPAGLPAPSGQTHTPASQTLCLEPEAASVDPGALPVNVEESPGGSEGEDGPPAFPAPLRHKELPVEQDFSGLLEWYISAKSLPEDMRAEEEEEEEEEEGRTVEVDGSAPSPGEAQTTRRPSRQLPGWAESGPGTPRGETGEQMASLKPAGFHASVARGGHPRGLGESGAAPASPGRPPHSPDAKSAAPHQSSLTSLEGGGIAERLPQKSRRHPGDPHLEESWLASPETDSGFVGSETSRVSPLAQTPEHPLSEVRTPGTLAQPFPASVPRDTACQLQTRRLQIPRRASEPSTPRSRTQRHPSTRGGPVRQRTASFRPEPALAPEMAVPRSQWAGRKRIPEPLQPSRGVSPPSTPAAAAAALPPGLADTAPLLLTRTGRDQAIRELQEEVSQLRLRLEGSLHQPPQSSPPRPASAFDRPTRARDRPADSPAAWGTHCGSKSTERLPSEPGGTEQAVPTERRRARSSSVPQEVLRLSSSSESELTSPQRFSEKSRTAQDSPRAARDKGRGMRSAGRPDRVTFRGQYTGQEYHVLTPKIVPRGSGSVSCPHCQPVRTQDTGGAAPGHPPGPSPADALRCPRCGRAGSASEGDGPDSATSGAERATARRGAPSTPSPKQRSKRVGSPPRPPPGPWYLAAAPPSGPAPPAFAYVSSVPVVPYPPATVFYAPPAEPASAPAAAPRLARRHRHSIQLDLEDLEELHRALNRAVQVAESVRSATKHMSRSLSADLRQAHSLRGSCLF